MFCEKPGKESGGARDSQIIICTENEGGAVTVARMVVIRNLYHCGGAIYCLDD